MTNEEKKDLLWALKLLDSERGKPALNWASNYVSYGIIMVTNSHPDADIKTQLLYILNNITRWRHSEAKKVREVLKKFVKAH